MSLHSLHAFQTIRNHKKRYTTPTHTHVKDIGITASFIGLNAHKYIDI